MTLDGDVVAGFFNALYISLVEEEPYPDEFDIDSCSRQDGVLLGPRTRLYTVQDWIHLAGLRKYLNMRGPQMPDIVIARNGQRFVWQGHHRIVAARLTGSPLYVCTYKIPKPRP
jgi:hypothetical protein